MELDIKKYKNIYMIGIGGMSMSGLAQILKSWNYTVSGSDANRSKQTDLLESINIKVFIGHKKENITKDIELIVYSGAIKEDNPELLQAKEYNIPCLERGNFLGELTKLFKDTIGISGTHGKSTTTSMVSQAFIEANLDPSVQIGANLAFINGNYRLGKSDYFIIEACEFRDSFLNFKQKSAIILNIDNDHLDYFGTIDNTKKSFEKYVAHLPKDGILILNNDDKRVKDLINYTDAKCVTVGKDDSADWTYKNIEYDKEGFASYDAYYHNENKGRINLRVCGIHNVFNSLCCIALCNEYSISIDIIAKALNKFTGVSRRIEFKGTYKNAKVYDDCADHPTEIKATFEAIHRKQHNKIWVIFEAHTYSRFAEHVKGFAESLKNFDNIIITDICSDRGANIYNIKEQDLIEELNKLNKKAIHISEHSEIINYISNKIESNDIILIIGSGIVKKLPSKLTELSD